MMTNRSKLTALPLASAPAVGRITDKDFGYFETNIILSPTYDCVIAGLRTDGVEGVCSDFAQTATYEEVGL